MEPVSLIMVALAAGALRGAGDSVADAVKDACDGLVSALKRIFARNRVAQAAIDEYAADPQRNGPVIEACLVQAGDDLDQTVIAAAIEVLRLADPDGFATGKYALDLAGSEGAQVNYSGGNTQNNQVNYSGGNTQNIGL